MLAVLATLTVDAVPLGRLRNVFVPGAELDPMVRTRFQPRQDTGRGSA